MSLENNDAEKMPSPEVATPKKPKKKRVVRAIFLVLPPEATVGELVRILPCKKKSEARKALEGAGIDITNHAQEVKLLRGDYIPLVVSQQAVFKF